MLTRYTIDSLADEIERQFQGADPERQLLRRFFREGKRHGRKGLSPTPMRRLLESAIEIATSKIAEEFLDEEKAAAANLAGMLARQKMLEEDVDDEATGSDASGSTGDPEASAVSAGIGTKVSGPDLSAALGRMKAQRAAREAAAREAQRRAGREQAEKILDRLEEEVAILEQQIEDLPEKYQQLVESCHETGELMWSRYCSGYVLGQSRRGSAASDDEGPTPEIEFEYPNVLDPDEEQKMGEEA